MTTKALEGCIETSRMFGWTLEARQAAAELKQMEDDLTMRTLENLKGQSVMRDLEEENDELHILSELQKQQLAQLRADLSAAQKRVEEAKLIVQSYVYQMGVDGASRPVSPTDEIIESAMDWLEEEQK